MSTDTNTHIDTGTNYDVVIAGAGPIGLLLACELRLGGARVLVAERLAEVDETIKAGGINTLTAVSLYRRGLLPALTEVQVETANGMKEFLRTQSGGEGSAPPPKSAGHFAGITLRADLLDTSDPAFAEVGPPGEVGRFVPQAPLERLLGRRADELGVEVRRQVELTGYDADDEGVTVHLAATDGSAPQAVRTGWLVGCDGGHSLVRKLAGIPFPGTAPEITGYQAIADLTGTEGLSKGWNATATGMYTYGPMPGRMVSIEFDGPPADRQSPVTTEELQASVRRVTGVDVTVHALHTATRFTDNCRQADTYRSGRVLLAGDAAHVHSPFGGQGLNLGVGDAMNLGWKLALVISGRAPVELLDTYTAERHPIGAWVLDWTRAQIAVMRPDAHARALRGIVSDLAGTADGTTYFVKRISGAWQRYDLPGDHPLTGRSAPDLELADGTRLGDHLHTGRALLLDLADNPKLRARAAGYEGLVDVLTTSSPQHPELAGLLVRPDGFTAWATDTDGAEDDPSDALRLWFGAPLGA